MELRIIHHMDRPGDVDPITAVRLMATILANRPILQSIGADKAALSVHPYLDPASSGERWALVLMGDNSELIVADASAKRHVFKAYRELVALGEQGHHPTPGAPHAWDLTDLEGVPTNKG